MVETEPISSENLTFVSQINYPVKILVTGANGQLGRALQQVACPPVQLVALDRAALDICSPEAWDAALHAHQPDLVIQTAAYTDVAGAEQDVQNAERLNVYGAALSAQKCADANTALIHISTDYVFDGKSDRPYRPEDPTRPLSVYGKTKLDGEHAVSEAHPEAAIVRVSWLFSPWRKNFLITMLNLFTTRDEVKVVTDQVASPTEAIGFADQLLKFALGKPKGGVYHFSFAGEASWFDLAKEIHTLSAAGCQLTPVDGSVFPSEVERPAYSKLDAASFEAVIGESLPHWKEVLQHSYEKYYLHELNR
jgi:dTDP-4-dehydrorhamnose reductase